MANGDSGYEAEDLIQVALGQKPAHRYLRGGRVLSVYTGELLPHGVAVWGDRIAYVGNSEKMIGEGTEVVDLEGCCLVPGYIDAHGHADYLVGPRQLARRALPLGTTAVMTDTHDICGALGRRGMELIMNMAADLPLRFYYALGWLVPPNPDLEGEEYFPMEEWEPFLRDERVISLSETTSWPHILSRNGTAMQRMKLAGLYGKKLEGHAAGCSPEKLNALAAAGITSCHESIKAEEVLERLRLGLWVMVREGSIRRDLGALAQLLEERPGLDTTRVMLTPDWMSAADLLRLGYMDHLIREAMRLGIPPVKAYQMATINPAAYLGLDHLLGGIAPGRYADILVLGSLDNPTPLRVMAGGRWVAREGRLTVELDDRWPPVPLGDWPVHRRPAVEITPRLFRVPVAVGDGEAVLPAIDIVDKTITRLVQVRVPVVEGEVHLDGGGEGPGPGTGMGRDQVVLKISMLQKDGRGFVTGLLAGLGTRVGGLATTLAHDHHKPMVLGVSDEDMALALRRLLEIGGGFVIAEGGEVVREFPLEVGGILPGATLEEAARQAEKFNSYLQERGCPLDDPVFTIGFLSFASLPYARLTPSGVLEVIRGQIVFP